MNDQDTLLEFPCDFPIKVFGRAAEGFDARVVEIIRRHAPELGEGAVSSRPSRNGNYVAVTVNLRAESKAQLDAIYLALSASEQVVMCL